MLFSWMESKGTAGTRVPGFARTYRDHCQAAYFVDSHPQNSVHSTILTRNNDVL